MSLEQARKFLLRVGTDQEFRQHLESAGDWRRFAQVANYDFTLEEFEMVTKEIVELEELREEMLEAIAGGHIFLSIYGIVAERKPPFIEKEVYRESFDYERSFEYKEPSQTESWESSWKLPIPRQQWWPGNS